MFSKMYVIITIISILLASTVSFASLDFDVVNSIEPETLLDVPVSQLTDEEKFAILRYYGREADRTGVPLSQDIVRKYSLRIHYVNIDLEAPGLPTTNVETEVGTREEILGDSKIEESEKVITMQIDSDTMRVQRGSATVTRAIDSQGSKPIIVNSRTILPIRNIIETFGGELGWEDATKTISIIYEDRVMEFQIDNKIALINGDEVELDVPPEIINGRTFLSVRNVAEMILNRSVEWCDEERSITIS